MGINNGNAAANSTSTPTTAVEPTTFKFKVVEHLSWDSYDNESRTFKLGHEDNRPIANREFKIKQNGNEIIKSTDANGVIELDGELTDEYEIMFEPRNHPAGVKHNIFYNKITVVDKSNDDTMLIKSDLMSGGDHLLSILRHTVIVDSHMHIQSARCAPIKYVQSLSHLTKHMQRKTIENTGIGFGYFIEFLNIVIPVLWFFKLPFTGSPVRELPQQGKKSTRQNGDDYIKDINKAYSEYLRDEKLYTGLSKLFVFGVVMTMDMEYAHVDGYYGLKIYNPLYAAADAEFINAMPTEATRDKKDGLDDLKIYKAMYKDKDEKRRPEGYWFPVHGKWVEATEIVDVETYETRKYQRFEEISDRSETRYVRVGTDELSAQPIDIDEYKKQMGKYDIEGGEKVTPSEKREEHIIIGSYFDPKEDKTVPVKVQAVPVLASEQEVLIYEQWERQLLYTELSVLQYPLKLLPMFHYDPRRWQTYGKNGNVYPLSQVGDDGLYIGFKMYTAQGYKPLDPRLPIMRDFYARCCKAQIPIMNHCTPGGAKTYEMREYLNFYHFNDSAEDRSNQKKGVDSNRDAEDYFDEHFVSPSAWEKLLKSEVLLDDVDSQVCGPMKLNNLRLCLAHFGGPIPKGLEWNKKIIEMIKSGEYPNLYTDISSSFADEGFRKHFSKVIADPENKRLKDRVLFGTDWFMTFLYAIPFVGKDFMKYCQDTKKCLDEIDTSLWPRFTQINPYTFYRLDEKIERIARNIIKRRADEDVLNWLGELKEGTIEEILREAAYLKEATKDYLTIKETLPLWKE